MNISRRRLVAGLIVGTALAVVAGCSTTKSTEDMLSAAGFKIVPANTPARQAQLKALPSGQISRVQRNGKNYFIFPDPGQNVLYVGQDSQYQYYQNLRVQAQMAADDAAAASMNTPPDWDAWEAWDEVPAPVWVP